MMRPEESRKGGVATTTGRDQFPVGMRVLAVDDDPVCLKVLETLLRRCQYEVTTTDQAVIALKMLQENRDMFDLVISDVHMPYMDGFQLLERVGAEMDLPVVMLSVNGETKSVMKGITSGACDYLLKPVRIEELKNIWQHVVRRRHKLNTNPEKMYEGVTNDQSERPNNKRKEYDSVDEDENEDSNGQKRARFVWSDEMHMKFVTAVTKLGLNKAVPRRILELMDVKNLTRENVASHLQKYRLHLRRLDTLKSRQSGIYAALGGRDPFLCMNEFLRLQGYYKAITSPPALSSFSAKGLLNSVRNENKSAVVSHAVSVQTDANTYHRLSLPGNQHGNLAQGLVPSLGQVQLQHKFMSADDSGDLSTIVSGNNSLATGCPLLPQDQVVECTEANMVIQPSIRVSSASLELLEAVVGSSFGPLESQQSALGFPVHGSFNSYGATRLGATFDASGNSFTLKANESSANSLIGPRIAKSSSQLPSTFDAQHSINQRSTNYSMFGHTSAGASPVVPNTKIAGDTSTLRIALEPSIPRLPSDLRSSTCTLDSLLDSMIKFKVDNGDAASNDNLWCDFYPYGACT